MKQYSCDYTAIRLLHSQIISRNLLLWAASAVAIYDFLSVFLSRIYTLITG